MKIMVGMGSIDDYEAFVNAGADEIFVGYVPEEWIQKYGIRRPINRREVVYYNVQIGSMSELMILKDMVEDQGVNVSLAFNALSYEKNQYEDLLCIMKKCADLGFDSFIIADPQIIEVWKEDGNFQAKWILSGEYGEINPRILSQMEKNGVGRIIFPRQTSPGEMKRLIEQYPGLEYEAFTLNEKCHYTGAYCNSMHCDELCHMCRIPYHCDPPLQLSKKMESQREFQTGFSGCGLCALWDFKEAGITHLKIVSRGNGSEETLEDISCLKKALQILAQSLTKSDYIKKMKSELFPEGCGGNCYYADSLLEDKI